MEEKYSLKIYDLVTGTAFIFTVTLTSAKKTPD